MIPLLYYWPDTRAIPADWVWRFDPAVWDPMPPAIRGRGVAVLEVEQGPAGPGIMVAPGDVTESIVYAPDRQDWTEIEPGTWIGIHHDAEPPHVWRAGLVPRHDRLADAVALTTDRGEWIIPIASIDPARNQLPQVDAYIRGEWQTLPAAPYRRLAEDAILAYRAECGEVDLTREQRRDIAIRALQVNHALTGPELAAMGVLFDDAYDLILAIITDYPARKKKAPSAPRSTDSGVSACSPTTAPPSTTLR